MVEEPLWSVRQNWGKCVWGGNNNRTSVTSILVARTPPPPLPHLSWWRPARPPASWLPPSESWSPPEHQVLSSRPRAPRRRRHAVSVETKFCVNSNKCYWIQPEHAVITTNTSCSSHVIVANVYQSYLLQSQVLRIKTTDEGSTMQGSRRCVTSTSLERSAS